LSVIPVKKIRKDSILKDLKIPLSKFVLAVKLFILEEPVNRAYKELGIAYNTAYRVYSKIRYYIYQFVSKDDKLLSGEVEGGESYFGGKRRRKRGRGAKDKIPVFFG